jgi:catechol 2,3-dioxygenase-like lactoylglutathione lyase family enzyme
MFRNNQAFSGFSVDDLAKAKAFYSGVLGMQVDEENDFLYIHIANGSRVLIYPKGEAHQPATYTILNLPTADVEAAVDALTAAGVQFEHYDGADAKGIVRGNGPNIAWFRDPAGNYISVIES